MNEIKSVLDVCCGTRSMWDSKSHPAVCFGDIRNEEVSVTDQSHGKLGGTRTLKIAPDVMFDFRRLPFSAGQFLLVVFDPPHLVRCGSKSWLAAKYGKLSENWRDDLREGFAECFRVLSSNGVLVFKWNETNIPVKQVLECLPQRPLFGHLSGHKKNDALDGLLEKFRAGGMITLADFFPHGRVEFVKPPWDERYWGQFGIPARCQPHAWGYECQRGLQYHSTGAAVASGTAGVVRKLSVGRKARGSSFNDYERTK